MSKGTKQRSIRVDDALWDAAQAKASEQGDNLSAVIRIALIDYISEGIKNEHQ